MTDQGPVQPLYLNLDEVRALAVAVGYLLATQEHLMLNPDNHELVVKGLTGREGPQAVARADQVLAAAHERQPILQSLMTALTELGFTLERTQLHEDDEP